jgi:Planctomycete cytochrome C/WD domain, G-beta repeat
MTYPKRCQLLPLLLVSALAQPAAAQAPSYARQVKPFLARYCLECHNASTTKGELDLETIKGLLRGGKDGPVVVPGRPDASRLVLLPEHKAKPAMPPKKARQPEAAEVSVLRAWVAAGARDDSTTITLTIPEMKPRAAVAVPITAAAYQPAGKFLAVGQQRAVLTIELASGEVVHRSAGAEGRITSLAYSSDGCRLAAAASLPGRSGTVTIYRLASGLPEHGLEQTLAAHQDAILDMTFSPDGSLLATTGYDRLIKLWDVRTGKELRTLKDHSDSVYGLAFSPDGKLLASGAADRAVKVWDVASGKRLYTLGEPTDWVYAVAWSPDGRHLAAGGVDRSIRVWEVSASGGRIVQSAFAHEGAITRLVYSTDGKTLYSLSEDRTAKAWDAAQMIERKVYPRQPESVLALAVRPDHQQLALGRYDGHLVLVDEATGKVQAEPLPVKPKPPKLVRLIPDSAVRGRTARISFHGKHLNTVQDVVVKHAGAQVRVIDSGRSSDVLEADITFPADTPAGRYQLALKSAAGESGPLPLFVDLYPAVPEREPNDSPKTGQQVKLPVTVVGGIGRPGGLDYYRFEGQPGLEVGVQILTSAVGSKLNPVLEMIDPSGRILAESKNGLLACRCEHAGSYAVGIHDRDYGGGKDMGYRLYLGNIPIVASIFPLGLQRGTQADIHVDGVQLGGRTVRVNAPPAAAPGSRLPVSAHSPHGGPVGDARVVVGEFAEAVATSVDFRSPTVLPTPVTVNGWVGHPGATDLWRFSARKGQPLVLEVQARRLGSPLDSYIEILDASGRPVPRAVLRCVARTYITFRDHDSLTPSIRLEAWSELAMKDYVWVGNQLLRIWELPRNPDDDCQFYSKGGQRVGYLDTTPTQISLGLPMYKVTIHPPGTTFPPTGFPVIGLDYRNDDGGAGFGKDSRLTFDPPADGEYQVRVGDSRNLGGPNFAYRLTIRPPRPSFTITFEPKAPAVWRGAALPVSVTADRIDGFDGPIEVELVNLPAGFSAPRTTIPAGENSTALALWADANAGTPAGAPAWKVVARAAVGGQTIEQVAAGGPLKVADSAEVATTTHEAEVTVRPGQQVWMTARIERRKGFKGRVPLDVRGLPHGVRVLDIGLNGILITEKETSRAFAIYAEPWVKTQTHPFVVLARDEGKGTEFAAKSVLLHIAEEN